MTESCPTPDGLSEQTRLALAIIFGQIQDATANPAVQLWANSVEDLILGYSDEPGVPLDALDDTELCAVHPVLVTAVSVCDDVPYRNWLIALGRMITDELCAREADQMLINAKAAAIDAEETRRDRERRKPENLTGLPRWSELWRSHPYESADAKVASPQRIQRRVLSLVLSAARRMLAAARRSSGFQSGRR
ncbi:hypothetical protein ACRU44_23560 [Mycobacterium colombiense]